MSVFSSDALELLLSRLRMVKEHARSLGHAVEIWQLLKALRQTALGNVDPEFILGLPAIVSWLEQKRLQRDVLSFLESSGPTRRPDILMFLRCLPVYEQVRESALDAVLAHLESEGQLLSRYEPHDDQPTYDISWRGQGRPAPVESEDGVSPLMAELLNGHPSGAPAGSTGFFTRVTSTARGIKSRVTRRPGRLEPADGEEGFVGAGELRGKIRSDLYWPLVISLRQFIEAEMQHHRLASEREQPDLHGELYFRGMIALQPQPLDGEPSDDPAEPEPDPEVFH